LPAAETTAPKSGPGSAGAAHRARGFCAAPQQESRHIIGRLADTKARAGKKTTPAKKAPKGRTKAKVATATKPEARDGSKTAKILDLLERPGGVTSKELMKATGWQPHSYAGSSLGP
jgi:hypothetical protein